MLLLLLLFYAFLQFNFSLISHNFGIRQGDLVDFRVFYLLVSVVITFVTLRSSTIRVKVNGHSKTTFGAGTLKKLAVYLITLLLIYVTTLEL